MVREIVVPGGMKVIRSGLAIVVTDDQKVFEKAEP